MLREKWIHMWFYLYEILENSNKSVLDLLQNRSACVMEFRSKLEELEEALQRGKEKFWREMAMFIILFVVMVP